MDCNKPMFYALHGGDFNGTVITYYIDFKCLLLVFPLCPVVFRDILKIKCQINNKKMTPLSAKTTVFHVPLLRVFMNC